MVACNSNGAGVVPENGGASAKNEGAGPKNEGAGAKDDGAGHKNEGAGAKDDRAGPKNDGAGAKDDGADPKNGGAGLKDGGAGAKDDGAGSENSGADAIEGLFNKLCQFVFQSKKVTKRIYINIEFFFLLKTNFKDSLYSCLAFSPRTNLLIQKTKKQSPVRTKIVTIVILTARFIFGYLLNFL